MEEAEEPDWLEDKNIHIVRNSRSETRRDETTANEKPEENDHLRFLRPNLIQALDEFLSVDDKGCDGGASGRAAALRLQAPGSCLPRTRIFFF